jgi:hypothetical protein
VPQRVKPDLLSVVVGCRRGAELGLDRGGENTEVNQLSGSMGVPDALRKMKSPFMGA